MISLRDAIFSIILLLLTALIYHSYGGEMQNDNNMKKVIALNPDGMTVIVHVKYGNDIILENRTAVILDTESKMFTVSQKNGAPDYYPEENHSISFPPKE